MVWLVKVWEVLVRGCEVKPRLQFEYQYPFPHLKALLAGKVYQEGITMTSSLVEVCSMHTILHMLIRLLDSPSLIE